MLAEERLEAILRRLRERGTLTVDNVAQDFNVSLDTVRRDFNRLAGTRGVRRTHGGILLEKVAPDSTLAERALEASAEKRAIARRAAELVHDNETIVVDAGTTTGLMVEYIEARDVTLITYSVEIAARAMRRANLTVYMAGGMVRASTGGAVGDDTLRMIRSLQASTAFVGANGFSVGYGLMTPNYHEASVKRAIIEISSRRVLLVDSSKANRRALARFGELEEMDVVISDDGLHRDMVGELEEVVGELLLVKGEAKLK
ncbi:MAG: DeoR/GlpR family DNA-binding transcription regulator [Alkalispirochaeta sp.]